MVCTEWRGRGSGDKARWPAQTMRKEWGRKGARKAVLDGVLGGERMGKGRVRGIVRGVGSNLLRKAFAPHELKSFGCALVDA